MIWPKKPSQGTSEAQGLPVSGRPCVSTVAIPLALQSQIVADAGWNSGNITRAPRVMCIGNQGVRGGSRRVLKGKLNELLYRVPTRLQATESGDCVTPTRQPSITTRQQNGETSSDDSAGPCAGVRYRTGPISFIRFVIGHQQPPICAKLS